MVKHLRKRQKQKKDGAEAARKLREEKTAALSIETTTS
jgi:hypothetical protein